MYHHKELDKSKFRLLSNFILQNYHINMKLFVSFILKESNKIPLLIIPVLETIFLTDVEMGKF